MTTTMLVGFVAALALATAAPAIDEKRAWAALLTGNVENMTSLALLQVQSIRRFSKYQTHLTMVTPEVNDVARRQLRAAGSYVVDVDLISPKWQISASWWTTVFTKLQIFGLGATAAGPIDQVAFVDLDAFITSAQADTIFDACGARELCAVRDAANLCPDADGGQTVCAMNSPNSNAMLNAGVMVARPDARLLETFKRDLAALARPYATLPEQEFLSAYYLDGNGYRDEAANRFRFISPEYGQCWASGEQLTHAKIVHNCGPFKYGHHGLCAWEGESGAGEHKPGCLKRLLEWSEGPERAAEPPRQAVLALYQELHVEANPCSVHGRSAATCAAAGANNVDAISGAAAASEVQCAWCDDAARCLPRGACLPSDTPAKKAQADRWQVYLKEREWLASLAAAKRRQLSGGGVAPPMPPGYVYVGPPLPPGIAAPPALMPSTLFPPALMPSVAASPPPPSPAFASPPPSPSPTSSPPAASPPAAPPPPPTPSLPPASPGAVYAYEVSATFVMAGEVATFDATGFRTALLAVFTGAVDATLNVTSASIRVDAALLFARADSAVAAVTTITTTPAADMQTAWFGDLNVTITQPPTAQARTIVTTKAALDGAGTGEEAETRGALASGAIVGIVLACLVGVVALAVGAVTAARRLCGPTHKSLRVEPDGESTTTRTVLRPKRARTRVDEAPPAADTPLPVAPVVPPLNAHLDAPLGAPLGTTDSPLPGVPVVWPSAAAAPEAAAVEEKAAPAVGKMDVDGGALKMDLPVSDTGSTNGDAPAPAPAAPALPPPTETKEAAPPAPAPERGVAANGAPIALAAPLAVPTPARPPGTLPPLVGLSVPDRPAPRLPDVAM